MGNTLKVVGVAAALAVAMTPSASARYYAYGTLQAYEGTRLVAEGKGSHGVDFGKDAIGGHIGSRDPRPGGSPARGRIWYQYTGGGLSPWYNRDGGNNYTSSWVDKASYGDLNTSFDTATTYGQICQVDNLTPDDCKKSDNRNHSW